jgi:HSP20 family molecular chaperone IbpA|tara:strand:+ start:876 stop:1250 length:375 start_codon:yes stop_codon:yes gene_type:complete
MYLTNLSKLDQGGMFDAFDNFFNFPVARKEWDTLGITGPDYKVVDDSLLVSLPGFSKKDINLETEGHVLTISAKGKEGGYTQSFSKQFKLPSTMDMDSITASMEDGILTLSFKTTDTTRKITIK